MKRTWERDIFDDYDEAMQAAWEAAWGQDQDEEEVQDPWTEEDVLRSLVNERLEELRTLVNNLTERLRVTGDLSAEEWNTLAEAWEELNSILEGR